MQKGGRANSSKTDLQLQQVLPDLGQDVRSTDSMDLDLKLQHFHGYQEQL